MAFRIVLTVYFGVALLATILHAERDGLKASLMQLVIGLVLVYGVWKWI